MSLDLTLRSYLKAYDTNGNGLDKNEAYAGASRVMSLLGETASFTSVLGAANNAVTAKAPDPVGVYSGVQSQTVDELVGEQNIGLQNLGRQYEESSPSVTSNGFSFFI